MRKIIVTIAFNTLNFDHVFNDNEPMRLNPEWLEYRMNIFMNYTLKSLVNQTNQDFLAILSCDIATKDIIDNLLSKYNPLPQNILFSYTPNKAIIEKSIGYDELYLVRLDSDDMYEKTFIQQLHEIDSSNIECIINQNGYVYDSINDRLAGYFYISPPFYTLVYNREEYVKGFRYKLKGGHPEAINLKHLILPKRNFMVVVHNKNTLNRFNAIYTRELIDDNSLKESILSDFNIH